MLELRINNKTADLPPNASIPMSLISPYLLYDRIPSSTIKPPTLPFSPVNRQIFNFYEEPTSNSIMPEYDWALFSAGELVREGFYRITEASEKDGKYVGTFTEKLDEFFGELQSSLLADLDLGTLALPGSLTAAPIADLGMPAVCFPTVLNSDYYGTSGYPYTGKMNDHNGSNYVANSPLCPMIFLKYLFRRIADLSATTITGSFLSHSVWQHLIIFNTRALDGATSIDLSQYLPELTVEQLFLEIRKLPNLSFDFDSVNRILKIDFWDEMLIAPTIIDWSEKAIVGGTKVVEQNTRIQLGYELDGNDALMKDKPAVVADYTTPQFAGQTYTGIAKIPSKFSTLLIDAATGLPHCKQEGITSINNQLTKKASPRLLFWNGIIASKPVALPTLNGQSLYWNGTDGLRAKHWSNTEALRASQFYLKKQLNLSEIDIANFDFSQKVHINGVDYLVAQIDITLPIQSPADVLLIGGL